MIPRNLRQTRAAKAQKSRSRVVSLPAPVGGWNARDSIAAMDEEDAVDLINWFPQTTDVVMRYGSVAQNAVSSVAETLMAYEGGTTEILIAASNNFLVDTLIPAIAGAPAVSSLRFSSVRTLNNRFQYVNFATSGGNYIMAVNGADLPWLFDGSSWTNPSITGITSTRSLIGVNAHKFRLWFVESGTLKAYYLPTSSIAGALSTLDLSSIFTRGGYLMAMATWTIDAGYGVDDLAVFVTSEGEVAIYRGTDPASSSTWALVGIFMIGTPIGRRCFTKYKGDLLIICQDGLLPLSGALQSSRLNPKVALTDKIQFAISTAIASYGGNFGWQVIPFPKQNMIVLNVPILSSGSGPSSPTQSEQYVMNTITGAWGRFQGWNATCFEIFNDELYFGNGSSSNGVPEDVIRAWVGTVDAGSIAITTNALQAFSYFGSPGQVKRMTSMRPVMMATGAMNMDAEIAVNFNRNYTDAGYQSFSPNALTASLWDSATWDSGVWVDDFAIIDPRLGATGVGYSVAPRLRTSSSTVNMKWLATDIVLEPGAIL